MGLLHRARARSGPQVWPELLRHEAARTTGRLRVHADVEMELYLYRGCPYAVTIPGWDPDVVARLVTGGQVAADQAEVLRADVPDDRPAQGRQAVEAGLVDAEELGLVHQEFLLSALGVAVDHGHVVGVDDGAVTDQRCAIPLESEPLAQTLRLRHERSVATWRALGIAQDPARVTFACDAAALPDNLKLPEVEAVVTWMATPRSLDEVAGLTGLTRAEALHILGALLQAGIAAYTTTPAPAPPDGVWWTAEQTAPDDLISSEAR